MTLESTPTWLIGPEVPPSGRIGTVLSGTYRLDAFLGQGLTGISYNAWHLRQKMPFAVKLLHRDLQPSHERVIRLRQDLRALSALGHHGFLPVELSFAPDGAPYLAAELLVGETLRQRLSRGAMPSLAAGIAVASVARALSAAHAIGMVHGDLRPENIFIPALPGQEIAAGQPTLLDAALHHLRRRPIGLDESLPLGKLAYLAPEQASGEVSAADVAGDIFALGAILYECLSGQQAFGASEIEVVLEKLAQPPAPLLLPREVGAPPGLGEALDVVIAGACARDPEARIPSMAMLLAALSQAYTGVGLPLPPPEERLPVLSPGRARRSTVAQKKVVPLRPVSLNPRAEYLANDDDDIEIMVERSASSGYLSLDALRGGPGDSGRATAASPSAATPRRGNPLTAGPVSDSGAGDPQAAAKAATPSGMPSLVPPPSARSPVPAAGPGVPPPGTQGAPSPEPASPQQGPPPPPSPTRPQRAKGAQRATVRARDIGKLLAEVQAGRLDPAQAVALAGSGEEVADDPVAAASVKPPTEAERVAEAGRAAVLARAEAARAAREEQAQERARREAEALAEAEAVAKAAKQKVLEAARAEVLSKIRAELDEKQQRDRAERAERLRVETERVAAARREADRLEAERREAERLEAEQAELARTSARRAEEARQEAERLEAALREAEQASALRAEAARAEAARAEAARAEAARAEAARDEAARKEAERVAAAHKETERAALARQQAAAREEERQAAAAAWEEAAQAQQRAEAEAEKAQEAERAQAAARAEVAAKMAEARKAAEQRLAQQARDAAAEALAAQSSAQEAAAEVVRAHDEEVAASREVQAARQAALTAEEAGRREAVLREEAARQAAAARAASEARLVEAALAQEAAREAEAQREKVAERVTRMTQALAVVRQTCQIEIVDLGGDVSEMYGAPPPIPAEAAALLSERPTLALPIERAAQLLPEAAQPAPAPNHNLNNSGNSRNSADEKTVITQAPQPGPPSAASPRRAPSSVSPVASAVAQVPHPLALALALAGPLPVTTAPLAAGPAPSGDTGRGAGPSEALPIYWLPERRRGFSRRQLAALFGGTVVLAAGLGALTVWLLVRGDVPPAPPALPIGPTITLEAREIVPAPIHPRTTEPAQSGDVPQPDKQPVTPDGANTATPAAVAPAAGPATVPSAADQRPAAAPAAVPTPAPATAAAPAPAPAAAQIAADAAGPAPTPAQATPAAPPAAPGPPAAADTAPSAPVETHPSRRPSSVPLPPLRTAADLAVGQPKPARPRPPAEDADKGPHKDSFRTPEDLRNPF